MPRVRMGGFVLPFAADEFVESGLLLTALHLVVVVTIAVATPAVMDGLTGCSAADALEAWLLIALSFAALSAMTSAALAFSSAQGPLRQPHYQGLRKHVPALYFTLVTLLCLELACTCFGTYWVFTGVITCTDLSFSLNACLITGVAISWAVLGVYFSFLVLKFLWYSSRPGLDQVTWNSRLKTLLCFGEVCECGPHDKQEYSTSFDQIATLMADNLSSFRLAGSDVTAGLVMVRARQNLEEHRDAEAAWTTTERPIVKTPPSCTCCGDWLCVYHEQSKTSVPLSDSALDVARLEEVFHFAKYALASYGWPVYLFTNRTTGLCELMACGCRCMCCCFHLDPSYKGPETLGDNLCMCNRRATELHLGQMSDVLFVDFSNPLYKMPYLVAVDKRTGAVVVSVRGTLSLRDVIVDLRAQSTPTNFGPLFGQPSSPDQAAHAGILQSARRLHEDILKRGHVRSQLETPLPDPAGLPSFLAEMARDRHLATTKRSLIIVGHSLGAGCAGLLAPMLVRSFPDHNVRCVSYCPPGALVSPALFEETKHYTTCFVHGKDVIPRLRIDTVAKLLQEVQTVVNTCKLPKYRLTSPTWFPCLSPPIYERRLFAEEIPTHEASTLLHENSEPLPIEPLQMPGPALHICKTHIDKDGEHYAPFWCDTTEEFDEILISSDMIANHLPNQNYHALEKVMKDRRKAHSLK